MTMNIFEKEIYKKERARFDQRNRKSEIGNWIQWNCREFVYGCIGTRKLEIN